MVIEQPELRKPINKMMLKIIIQEEGGDSIKVNIPLLIIKACLDVGKELPQINGKNVLRDINLNEIWDMINDGVVGNLVEIESIDGDTIKIMVE